MRILVVGAGAIGGYFGGRLVEAGHDATFLVRPRRAAQLAADGLVIQSPKGNLTTPVRTITAEALKTPYDAIILSCKAYDLPSAMEAVAPAVASHAAILPLLNGMAHLDALEARFTPPNILGGQCQIAATLEPDGTIRHLGELAALSLGERDGTLSPRVESLAAALACAGGRASANIVQDMWEKWVFLASLATITSLMRAAVGDIVAAGGAHLAQALFDEASGIAAHNGHPPREAFTTRMRATIAQPGSTFTASMMRDIERGAPIEADHIVADLIARARPETTPLFRIGLVALKAYEARRARETAAVALPMLVPSVGGA